MKPDNSQTNKTQIDFSPFNEPVTDADIAAYKAYDKKTDGGSAPGPLRNIAIIFFISLIPILVSWSVIGELQLGGLGAVIATSICLGLSGAAAYGIWRMIQASTRWTARLYKFATRNNLVYISQHLDPGYAGMIFDEGHSRIIGLAFGFPGRAEIGNYTYTTGSGKNSQDHTWGYVKVKLPRKLPHMVLDAKGNNTLGMFTNLPDVFNKDQVLALEGDFNSHFTLYAPKEYERDAFYVFTPDVMAKLIDDGGGYDMEVVGDELFVYKSSGFNLDTEAEITKLLATVDSIGVELREQTDFYADERIGDRAQNIVAPQGMKLKHGFNWAIVVIIVFVIMYQFAVVFGE